MFKKFVKQKELDAAKSSSFSIWTTASPTSVNIQSINQSINLTYVSSYFRTKLQACMGCCADNDSQCAHSGRCHVVRVLRFFENGCCHFFKALFEQSSRLIFAHDYLHRHHMLRINCAAFCHSSQMPTVELKAEDMASRKPQFKVCVRCFCS
jgi:hypothetical protein